MKIKQLDIFMLNEITSRARRDYVSCPTRLRLVISMLLLLILGNNGVWGQTHPKAGVWYMKGHKDPAYYMVPAANPQITTDGHVNEDAYFSSDYASQAGDPDKPFITTYKTNGDLNSIWIFEPVSGENNYYYIVHAMTGKYVKYQTYLSGNNERRKFVHLETMVTPGETEKFEITTLGTGVKIKPKNNAMYLNVAGDNKNSYNGGTAFPYYVGIIGGMNGTDDNSQFDLIDASLATTLTPKISDVDESTSTFTITSPAAAFSKIRYTTDGSTTPGASTGTAATSGSPITITGNWSVQAVGVFNSFVTPMAGPKPLEAIVCATPVITYDYTTSKVSITCVTDGSTIYYTTDGSTPTSESTLYDEVPFYVENQTMLKAIAVKTGILDSEIASTKLVLNPTINLAETEYTYSGSAKEPAVSSVIDGETIIATREYTVSYSNNTDAGTATVNINDGEGGDYIVYGSATFTIHPAEVTLTANNGTKAYNGTEQTVTTGFTCSVDGPTFEGVSASGRGTNVGEYDVTFTGVTIGTTKDISGNYVVTGTTNGKLTITPKELTITAKPQTITYGDAPMNDGVTYSEFAFGEDKNVLSGTLAYAYNYEQYDDAGNYTITPSGLSNDNYNITFVPGTLTVGQKEVGLTWSETTSFPYDGSAHAPTANATGLVNSDAIIVMVTGAQTNAGNYTATASSLTGEKAGNYKLPDANTQEFSITKVPLTISANNNTITYGNAPVGNGVTCEGFVNSETASVLGGTLGYDFSYTQYSDVGNTYTITPKGLTSNNYDISFVSGTLTVNPKVVGIMWENTEFTYDGKEHVPAVTVTGLVNNDEVGVTVSGGQTDAGSYTATASALTGDKKDNYQLPEANTQSFTISPKSIGGGTLADGYTLGFGEGNTILLTDDIIGCALVIDTDYNVSDDRDASPKYSERTVTGKGNYTGYFDVRNVVVSFTTDTDQEEWSVTFAADKEDESDIGLALPDGVSAFIISGIEDEWAIPEPLKYIPEGVPVLLVAHKQINGFVVTKANSEDEGMALITPDQKKKNMLEEVTETTPYYDPDTESAPFTTKQIYVLYKNEFVFNKAGNMKKGKVYLNPNHTIPSSGLAPARLRIAWNNTTSIQEAKNGSIVKTLDDIWYTIDGRRLSGKPNVKGLYIVGGKKIVIK